MWSIYLPSQQPPPHLPFVPWAMCKLLISSPSSVGLESVLTSLLKLVFPKVPWTLGAVATYSYCTPPRHSWHSFLVADPSLPWRSLWFYKPVSQPLRYWLYPSLPSSFSTLSEGNINLIVGFKFCTDSYWPMHPLKCLHLDIPVFQGNTSWTT